jgi:hypothetical protein
MKLAIQGTESKSGDLEGVLSGTVTITQYVHEKSERYVSGAANVPVSGEFEGKAQKPSLTESPTPTPTPSPSGSSSTFGTTTVGGSSTTLNTGIPRATQYEAREQASQTCHIRNQYQTRSRNKALKTRDSTT